MNRSQIRRPKNLFLGAEYSRCCGAQRALAVSAWLFASAAAAWALGGVSAEADKSAAGTSSASSSSASASDSASASAPLLFEARGVRIAASDWADSDPARVRENIARLIENAAKAGMNLVLFQARADGEALYPSEIEPRSARLGGGGGAADFDPVAFALAECKRHSMQLHAWIPAFSVWDCARKDRPSDPRHILVVHGADSPDPWICCRAQGTPQECFPAGDAAAGSAKNAPSALFISAGNPRAQAHVRSVILEVADRYPEIGGIYLSDVAFPGADLIHDKASEDRASIRGNPNHLWRSDWQREQLTRFIRDITVQLRALHPQMLLSAGASGVHDRFAFGLPDDFPAGLQDRYEDPGAWARQGLVDFVVPEIDPRQLSASLTFENILEDYYSRINEPRTAVGIDLGGAGKASGEPAEETTKQADSLFARMNHASQTSCIGLILLTPRVLNDAALRDRLHAEVFSKAAQFPPFIPNRDAKSGMILGTVRGLGAAPVVDAVVGIEGDPGRRAVTSGDGVFTIWGVAPGKKSVAIEVPGEPARIEETQVESGKVSAIDISLETPAKPPAVVFDLLDPEEGKLETTREFFNVLGRARPGAKVLVGGEEAIVLPTGVFVRDKIGLEMGANTFEIVVTESSGQSARKTIAVTRTAAATPTPLPPSRPLFIDEDSLSPNQEVRLAPGEALEVGFRGAPGNIAEFLCPEGRWMRLDEESQGLDTPTGVYRGLYVPAASRECGAYTMRFRLRAASETQKPPDAAKPTEASAGADADANSKDDMGIITLDSKFALGVYGVERIRQVRVKDDIGHLLAGLHTVRLGGPYLSELPTGVILRVIGRRGGHYHVRLVPSLDAWIPMDEVEAVPPASPIPHLVFASVEATGDETDDILSIPYSSRIPFAVRPVRGPDGQAALEVDLWGAHYAQTWLSHKARAKIIREVTAEQVAEDHLRLHVVLKTRQLWGYRVEAKESSISIRLRRPPAALANFKPESKDSPLRGLVVGLEAGHGGSGSGAIGVSTGVNEKDINRWNVDVLRQELERLGARVIDCRRGDENPTLAERIRRAEDANADLFISVHSNAAGTSGGYRRVSGTSTYYKWISDRDFGETIHQRLLARTGLGDFGNVGDFNYTPIRTTWMPAMLVEVAFMSNPEDEAHLLDPAFREQVALAVREGTEDFLRAALASDAQFANKPESTAGEAKK